MTTHTYDALGNVVAETRTIALPYHNKVYQFRMHYQYDSWGRISTMTYPDGEEITYTYKWGGDLYAMHGDKGGDARTYIDYTQYNSFGQKSYVEYGNATSVYYTYDALHRLVNLQSRDHNGAIMQDIDYTFDNASNVTKIHNSAGVVNTIGGDYSNTYEYDVLHRLVSSDGGGAIGNYNTNLAYSPSGRLIEKKRSSSSVTLSASANMVYGYCDDYQPHTVKRIFDYENNMLYDMRWDNAGNLGQVSMANPGEMFKAGRFLFWTEDNRMHAVLDEKYSSYYAYDHSGERHLKLTGENDLLDVNADFMTTLSVQNEPTIYPSAYMVLTNKGYTKHYYAGTERVAARLGSGGLDFLGQAVSSNDTLREKSKLLYNQSLDDVNNRVLQENDIDCIINSTYAQDVLGHWIDGVPRQMQATVKAKYSQFSAMMNALLTDSNDGKENDVYFYHSDHLGSASWITDSSGTAVQHLQYLPYGEPYINQRLSGYNERYTFTGKERDEETGYGYFGARYMDHELMTMWLSADPLADKYPNLSPYNYCALNPIIIIDPDGMSFDGYESETGEYKWFNNHSEQTFNDVSGKRWNKITGDKQEWIEATTIREANIQGLVCLGYNRGDAEKDVRMYNGNNPLFTKESHLLNWEKYIDSWEDQYNSEGTEGISKKSPNIKQTGYSLKFYENKGGQMGVNSIGVIKSNILSHSLESITEIVEKFVYKEKSVKDPISDMHYNNAKRLIRRLALPNKNPYRPTSIYSNYHRFGGMKLP